MEIDPNLSLLHRNLKVDDPWLLPKSWESIPSESGTAGYLRRSQPPIYDVPVVSESSLVRLLMNSLLGVKSALVEIDKLCTAFSLNPADRTCHRIPSLWRRSSSSSALGKLLKSFSHSGVVFFFLRKFVDYNLCSSSNVSQSLVSQAFSVAVAKVLEAYVCALNTLLASVRLRRSSNRGEVAENVSVGDGSLMSVVHSEVTVVEVFLHTKELRTRIEALGNVCFANVIDLSSLEDFCVDNEIEFDKFPRGADLLTYLYVQLRDADPAHHELLKFLFIRSCEPYCRFIKSWIFRASTDDPHKEFYVVHSDDSRTSENKTGPLDDSSVAYVKELDFVSVPCFLKDVARTLIRAGQQLQVLVKLMNLCNCGSSGCRSNEKENNLGSWLNLVDILPCWEGASSHSAFLLDDLTFSRKGLEVLIQRRDDMYKIMLNKLQCFFSKLDMKYHHLDNSGIPLSTGPGSLGKRYGANISSPLPFDCDAIGSPTSYEQGTCDVSAPPMDSDASCTSDDFMYENELMHSSDSESLDSYGEESVAVEIPNQSCTASQPEAYLLSSMSICYASSILQNSSQTMKPSSLQPSSHDRSDGPSQSTLANMQHGDIEISQTATYYQLEDSKSARKSQTLNEDFHLGKCWPLGGILENPFYAHMKSSAPKLNFTECSTLMADVNSDTFERKKSYFREVFVSEKSGQDQVGRIKLMNGTLGVQSLCAQESWTSCDSYDLSANPMLRKAGWLQGIWSSRNRGSFSKRRPFLSYFDFSSVSNPCKVYTECLNSSAGNESKKEAPILASSGGPALAEAHDTSDGFIQKNKSHSSTLKSALSSREEYHFSMDLSQSASGGSDWEASLSYSGEEFMTRSGENNHSLHTAFEMPLDVVIDKCIVQDILLQYNYVSKFTIKLLEDGFNLCGHLLTLRRYHFMELADWADSFILSLCNQKWFGSEPKQKITEIQALLDLALQRSSCESDPYRGKLFVHVKGGNVMPLPTPATGVHTFDFLALGYRVDWPIHIILTPDALEIYADIFNYLIQVKLAAFSLTEVWTSLKDLMHPARHNRQMGSDEMKGLNTLIKMRQQINHFVSTLQQYVHSQLSDVSWSQFQHSLKHKVSDMFDLESVHMSYLADALRICFLSVDMQPIAIIIKNILQCALDFRLCFFGGGLSPGATADSSGYLSRINFTQVFSIKATFEKNIKDLYILFLKSPKHNEFSLCRFWSHLNYNEYYSTAVSQGTGYLCM